MHTISSVYEGCDAMSVFAMQIFSLTLILNKQKNRIFRVHVDIFFVSRSDSKYRYSVCVLLYLKFSSVFSSSSLSSSPRSFNVSLLSFTFDGDISLVCSTISIPEFLTLISKKLS